MWLVFTTENPYTGADVYTPKWVVKEVFFSEEEARIYANRLVPVFGTNGVMLVQKLDLQIEQ